MNTSAFEPDISLSAHNAERLNAILEEVWKANDSNPAWGLEQALEVIAVAREHQNTPILAEALRMAGRCCQAQALHPQALPYLFEALDLFDSLGNRSQIAACQNEIGVTYFNLGDYPDALDYFESSLKTSNLIGSKLGELVALYYLSSVHKHLQNYRQSLGCLERSLDLCHQINDDERAAWILYGIGDLHTLLAQERQLQGDLAGTRGELDAALAHFDQVDSPKRRLEHPRLIVQVLNARAEALSARGDAEAARRSGLEALELVEQVDDPALKARCVAGLGRIKLHSGDAVQAREQFETALVMFETLGIREEAARIHRELSGMHKTDGAFEQALEHFERFYALDAELRGEMAERRAQALAAKLEIEKIQRESEFHRVRSLELAAINGRLREQAELLDRQAREDSLTGIANRRHLEDHLREAFAQARAHHQPLTVVIADVDHFKHVNDRYSHAVGDAVLRQVADILRSHLRGNDLVARFGGEEFVLVLPGIHAQDAFDVCERIRLSVQDHDWSASHPGLEITISMGYSDDIRLEHHERLLAAADTQLYSAKNAGRNCVHPNLR